MLLQLIANHPSAIGQILKTTPNWVWGLLAALVYLGYTQLATRNVSLARIAITPIAMTLLSVYGIWSAFGASAQFAQTIALWAVAAVAVGTAIVLLLKPAAGSRYDAGSRTFHIPGSVVPMLLILGIFLTKYVVSVEVAMQPSLALDASYTLIVGGIYGAFSGIFAGRGLRMLKLVRQPQAEPMVAA